MWVCNRTGGISCIHVGHEFDPRPNQAKFLCNFRCVLWRAQWLCYWVSESDPKDIIEKFDTSWSMTRKGFNHTNFEGSNNFRDAAEDVKRWNTRTIIISPLSSLRCGRTRVTWERDKHARSWLYCSCCELRVTAHEQKWPSVISIKYQNMQRVNGVVCVAVFKIQSNIALHILPTLCCKILFTKQGFYCADFVVPV